MSQAQHAAPPAAGVPTHPGSSVNLVAFALSVGAVVLAAMTLAASFVLVIPFIVVCLTLSLLGAATKQPYALLGWVAAVLSAVALTLGIIATVSG